MDFTTKYKVNVITILHKLTTISSFLFISPLIFGFFAFLITQSEEFAIVCAIFGFFTPLIIAHGFHSTDYITLKNDGILFEKRGFIPFSDIVWYSTDYGMKLKIKNRKFKWQIGGKITKGDAILNFIKDFEEAMHLWITENQDLIKNSDTPKQKYFFGSASAKFIGAISIILSFFGMYVTYLTHNLNLLPYILCCILIGILLL